MKKIASVEKYLEKQGAGPLVSTIWKALGDAMSTPLGKALTVGIPIGIGGSMLWHGLGGGGVSEGARQGDTLSYRINKNLNSLVDRVRADEVFADSAAKAMGKGTADKVMGLVTDWAGKAYDTAKDTMVTSPVRHALFESLKKEDPILADTDNKTLLEAYHTMAKVAPTLATDKNAVRSFLTQAAVSGGGLDYNTIKGIADAELAVRKANAPLGVKK